MAITINALTTGTGGLETTADASGSFSFQSDGSTIATVTSSGFSVTGTFDAGSLQVGGSDVVVDTDIGSTVQAYDAGLTSIAGLTTAANKMIYATASDTYAVTDLTAAGRAILDDADAAAQRTTLGLGTAATTASTDYATAAQGTTADSALQPGDIGSTVQAYDADLTAIGGLAKTDGNFIVGNGTTWVVESGATARTSLGLGSLATLSSVDGSTIDDNSVSAAELNVSGNGTAGQALTSDGDGSFSWTTITTSVTPADVSDQNNTSTGYFDLPVGTTAQRPGSPTVGMVRYNTTESAYEVYKPSGWAYLDAAYFPYTIEYLIVAGGAGGGGGGAGDKGGGGGGAGGMLTGSLSVSPTNNYTVTVGGGGAGGGSNSNGANGGNSSFTGVTTAIGGGGGARGGAGGPFNGLSGGSGGGATASGTPGGTPGSGTAGQGNAGGTNPSPNNCSGGGGKGSVGGNNSASAGGNGGSGSTWSDGSTYAGGGGGGAYLGSGGSGGSGGGGDAKGQPNPGAGDSGTSTTGGGGGGAGGRVAASGGNGGSGVVKIRYAGSQRGTGGTVTSSGGYTYHTFSGSGTFTA
jgi:hypothetical protein